MRGGGEMNEPIDRDDVTYGGGKKKLKGRGAHEGGKRKCPIHCRRHTRRTRRALRKSLKHHKKSMKHHKKSMKHHKKSMKHHKKSLKRKSRKGGAAKEQFLTSTAAGYGGLIKSAGINPSYYIPVTFEDARATSFEYDYGF